MANLAPTATSVVKGSGANTTPGILGETVVPGDAVYLADATGLYMLADSNSATAEVRTPDGIALNGGGAGQPVEVLLSGPLTLGAILTAGVAYYLSDTPGKLCPVADVGSGEYATVIGIAASTTSLLVKINPSGVAL